MLFGILHDPIICLANIGSSSRKRGIIRIVHEVPHCCGLEGHYVGSRLCSLNPVLESFKYPVSGRISTNVTGEFSIATKTGAGFLDRFFKGLILLLAFDPCRNFTAGCKPIELSGNIHVKFFIHVRIGVVSPNVLFRNELLANVDYEFEEDQPTVAVPHNSQL